jgi:hypothetical protein
MSKTVHRKPTRPFGTIVFGKNGSVRRNMSQLPDAKIAQEQHVAESFCVGLIEFLGKTATVDRAPAEDDHDANVVIDGMPVKLQLTELPQRAIELPPGTPNRGDPKAIAFFDATSSSSVSLDVEAINGCVLRAITRKLDKRYARPAQGALWLVLFTTSVFITMEYEQNGCLQIGEPLRRARHHFETSTWHPFDEVWFTNLRLRPVRVLPP